MKSPFFVTTPIYYPNDVPHVGHAYTSLIADTIARHHRMKGDAVKFSTGVDENSQKIVEKANELGRPVMEYLDEMAGKHQAIWNDLGISYTDFVRTTAPAHKELVQKVLQITYDKGDIYEGTYEGHYCIGCEGFKKPSDLTPEGKCPLHPNRELEFVKEKNYFFRLSKYQDRLLKLYEEQPDFVIPDYRFREVIEFAKAGLEDFSISRETNKFGIPLPFDPSQVTYVWYDALFNYVSICGDQQDDFWPANLHIIGKDIVRFHAIFWPAMLMAADMPLPKNILTHGFFTVDGQKMSKSLGNVVAPLDVVGKYGRDFLILYLLLAFPIGGDGDYSEKEAILTFNSKLANNLGNLLNRFIVLSLGIGGKISGELIPEIAAAKGEFIARYHAAMDRYDLRDALAAAFDFGDTINKYVDTMKPWTMKDPSQFAELEAVMYQVGEALRTIAIALSPFFATKMSELLERIGAGEDVDLLDNGGLEAAFARKTSFEVREKGEPLYMRISL